ncbi:MAG: hypothetical protein QXZ31_05660 [Thermofilaceae archaeon]
MPPRWGRVVDVEEVAERIADLAMVLLVFWMLLDTLSVTMGYPVYEFMSYVIRYWRIPLELIEELRPLWIALSWVFILIVVGDHFYASRYREKEGRYPPASYARYVSLLIFSLGVLLFLVFQAVTYLVFAVFAAMSFGYSLTEEE